MSDNKKRSIRVILAIAGIMSAFTAMPVDATEWIRLSGGWIIILATAYYSNSDSILPIMKK